MRLKDIIESIKYTIRQELENNNLNLEITVTQNDGKINLNVETFENGERVSVMGANYIVDESEVKNELD